MLQLAVVTALLCGLKAQYCSPGAVPAACDTVLVVHADPSYPADVQETLLGTGAFTRVDLFDARYTVPTAEQLADYHAILVYSNSVNPFKENVLLGDRLAAYHDQGGGVVIAMFANAGSRTNRLQGVYGMAANGYSLLDYSLGEAVYNSDSLGDLLEPQSPLLTGVTSFSASQSYRSTAPIVSGRGVVVARWRGGMQPLLLRGARGNRTLVELNFAPASSRAYSQLWTGDGAALMRNALKFSRCIFCGNEDCALSGFFNVPAIIMNKMFFGLITITFKVTVSKYLSRTSDVLVPELDDCAAPVQTVVEGE